MLRPGWISAAALAVACAGGEKAPADRAAPPAVGAPEASAPAANLPEAGRPTDSASSARAQPALAKPSVKAAPEKKTNAAVPGELRDSVIKPSFVIDEKTGAVTPIKKPR
jgi:hypothetical protein